MINALETIPVSQQSGQSADFSQDAVSYRFLEKSERDWYIAKTADFYVNGQWVRKFNGEMYMFNNIVYRPLDEASFYNVAYQYAYSEGITLKPGECKQLLQSVRMRLPESPIKPDPEYYTVFKNGPVSNIDGTLLSVYPQDYFPTIYVDANYLGNAPLSHPTADAFLDTISGHDPELIKRHWEFWGYVLSSDYRAKAIFSLYGPSGNNGKSTELDLIRSFLPDAVVSMPVKTMTSPFGRRNIQHCRLQYSADEGAVNLNSESIGFLKSASGFDHVTVDVKFKNMATFECKCKIAFASNYDIGMAYGAVDQAFLRRLVTLPYPYSIPKEQQNPMMLQYLLMEKDAIATEAHRHYLQLKANNYLFAGHERFDQMQSVLSSPVNDEYNAVRDFSDKYCDFTDNSAFTTTQDLYTVFAANYQTGIIDITGFSQAFNHVNGDMVKCDRKHTSTDNLRGYSGVKLILPPAIQH